MPMALRALLQYTLDLFGADSPDAPPPALVPAPPVDSSAPVVAIVPCKPPAAAYMHPRANREISLCGYLVAYEFKRSKRRTIGFSVGVDGLAVHAPKWVTVSDVHQAINEKAQWIVRKLQESRERHTRMQANRIVWRDGAEFPFLGASIRMVLDPSHAFGGVGACLVASDPTPGGAQVGELRLGLSQHANEQQIRDAVQAWLMRQARRIFTERLDHFAPRLQVQWRKLSLSSAGTRWGTARSDGSIRLHWRLVHFRVDVIDYVVAHELSHLRVMDHSPRFWDTVRSVLPDYQHLRGQLKDESIPTWD